MTLGMNKWIIMLFIIVFFSCENKGKQCNLKNVTHSERLGAEIISFYCNVSLLSLESKYKDAPEGFKNKYVKIVENSNNLKNYIYKFYTREIIEGDKTRIREVTDLFLKNAYRLTENDTTLSMLIKTLHVKELVLEIDNRKCFQEKQIKINQLYLKEVIITQFLIDDLTGRGVLPLVDISDTNFTIHNKLNCLKNKNNRLSFNCKISKTL